MKKTLLLILILAGLRLSANAALYSGAEMSYKNIAPNTYEVMLQIFSYCHAGAGPATVPVQLTAPGCNSGRSINLNQVKQQLKYMTGPAVVRNCQSASNGSILITTYRGVLTFTSAEQACSDWVLSWGECCRYSVTNILGMGNMYVEAHLKLLPNLINHSPEFDTINFNIAIPHFSQPALISALAQDPDGDSLVYSSVNPLSGYNQPIPYITFGGAGGYVTNPNPLPPFNTTTNPQVAIFPNAFSPAVPLYAFHVNWTPGVSPVQGQTLFEVNPETGNIAFTPTAYSPFAIGYANQYALAIQVDEYRKINGVPTKIGSIRRETMIFVHQGIGNLVPELSQVEVNATQIGLNDIIELRPGTTMNLKLSASDGDTANTLLMTSNVASILPGAVFNQNGAKQPSGTIIWTPTVADVRGQPYYFNVIVKDDASFYRGYHERTIGVRLRQNGSVTGVKSAQPAEAGFLVFPNPFTENVNFRFNPQSKAESIIIYNLLGQQIDEIAVPKNASGEHQIQWQNANRHTAGTYVAKLVSGNLTIQTLKFVKLQ